jgi:hypothetical protein
MSLFRRGTVRPPATFEAQLTVLAPDRTHVSGLRASLTFDNGAIVVGTDRDRVHFAVLRAYVGHEATLHLEAPDYAQTADRRIIVVPELGEILLTPIAPVQALVPQPTGGRDPYRSQVWALADGTPHTIIEATSFQSFDLWLHGKLAELDAHLGQLQALGFNCHRVFGMCRNLFDLDPTTRSNFYAELPTYVRYAARRFGLRTDFVVFPDCALVMNDTGRQLQHWARCGDALRPVSALVLVSLQNEEDQTPNRIDSAAFAPLEGLLCSHGSTGAVGLQVLPAWDWTELHTNDTYQWPRKSGHNCMEFGGVGLATENTRPDRDGTVHHFEDAAAGAALLCGGSCFHAASLRWSQVMTDAHELACAQAWVRGAMSVPLHCQTGGYRHRQDLEGPDAAGTGERVYQRGNDEACIVHVHGN